MKNSYKFPDLIVGNIKANYSAEFQYFYSITSEYFCADLPNIHIDCQTENYLLVSKIQRKSKNSLE